MHPEDEGVFETTPDTPALVRDFVDYGINYEPNSDSIKGPELGVLSLPLMGANSLALQLYKEFEESASVSDDGRHFYVDLNIVPSPESSDETNIIEQEYGNNYAVSDAYARYRMRIVAEYEAYETPARATDYRLRVVHIGIRDKLDKGDGLELFLNPNDKVDAGFLVNGRYSGKKIASPEQQLLVAAMINELLNPMPIENNGHDPDGELDPDLQ